MLTIKLSLQRTKAVSAAHIWFAAKPKPADALKLAYYYPNARWAYFDQDKCVTVAFNSLGFRDDEFAAQKQPGEFRAIIGPKVEKLKKVFGDRVKGAN